MAPSSRFAVSLKPNVVYPRLTSAHLEEADDLAVLGIRGHPAPEFRRRAGALALTTAWSRSTMERSDSGSSAIFASPRFAYHFASLRWWLTVCEQGRPTSEARRLGHDHIDLYQAHARTPAQNWRRRCPSSTTWSAARGALPNSALTEELDEPIGAAATYAVRNVPVARPEERVGAGLDGMHGSFDSAIVVARAYEQAPRRSRPNRAAPGGADGRRTRPRRALRRVDERPFSKAHLAANAEFGLSAGIPARQAW